MIERFAEGHEILVFPMSGEFSEDFAERLTEALYAVGIDWVYA